MLPTWMYAKSADGIYVNLFIGSTITVENVAGTDVEMVQETDYPWNGKVVDHRQSRRRAKTFSVRIRVPNRSVSELYTEHAGRRTASPRSRVNGAAVKPADREGLRRDHRGPGRPATRSSSSCR